MPEVPTLEPGDPVIIAARLSRKGQKEGIGIQTQDKLSREWCERQGLKVIEVVADYASGTVAPWDRKNLSRYVTRPKLMQTYKGVVAFKMDRLTRDEWENETRIRQWASKHGKVLQIVDGPQWPPRDDGDFWQWTALAKQANTEWRNGRERSMRTQRELRSLGKLVGRCPWGYAPVGELYNKTIAPTDEGRKFIPQIFKRIADGDSLMMVARWLDAEGAVPKYGGSWSPRTVGSLIRNRTYTGDHLDMSGRPLLTVEALVDAKLWTDGNRRLDNAPRGRRAPSNGETAFLTGVLFCPRCPRDGKHAPMYRNVSRNRGYYYRCAGHLPQRQGCGNMIELKETDEAAIMWLSAAPDPWKEHRLIPGENHDIEIADIRLEIRDLGVRDLSDGEYDAELKRLRKERDRLAALPNIPDRWDEVEICGTCHSVWRDTCHAASHHKVTVGEHFRSLDRDGRRAMMLEHVKVYGKAVHEGRKTAYIDLTIDSWLFKDPMHNEFATREPDGQIRIWPSYDQAKAYADATPGAIALSRMALAGDWQKYDSQRD